MHRRCLVDIQTTLDPNSGCKGLGAGYCGHYLAVVVAMARDKGLTPVNWHCRSSLGVTGDWGSATRRDASMCHFQTLRDGLLPPAFFWFGKLREPEVRGVRCHRDDYLVLMKSGRVWVRKRGGVRCGGRQTDIRCNLAVTSEEN